MSRIPMIDSHNASTEQQELLAAIRQQLGRVPNFLKVFAQSPVALSGFLGLHGIAGAGALDAATRERIALALAQQNGCSYCVSAHTAIGRKSGLSADEIVAARAGTSSDPLAAAAVVLANRLMQTRGAISAADLLAARAAGLTDPQIVEVIAHVGMNFLTNLLGKASGVEIDFPEVSLQLPRPVAA